MNTSLRLSCLSCFLVCAPFLLQGQSAAPVSGAAADKGVLSGPVAGLPLVADSDVPASVTVDAVLLPYDVARRTFSKEVADRYAVVQLTVSNQNPNASLILQSVFLDDRHWLFSGNLSAGTTTQEDADSKAAYHRQNDPTQVASVEARLVRGELQDAQPFTFRNLFLRSAIAVGTIAAGFQYLSASANVLAGISAYGNQAVPALGLLWPDMSQMRINRISDFGFQTNKVVSKSSSEVVVAFFPIERFLTPTLRRLYKKAPAAFFNPLELMLDDKYNKPLYDILSHAGFVESKDRPGQQKEVAEAFAQYEFLKSYNAKLTACGKSMECLSALRAREAAPTLSIKQESLLAILDRASLNKIRVTVGGIMTVDENAVPALITSVAPDVTDATPLAAGSHTVVITGTFLGGGVPSVVGAEALGISAVAVVPDKSTDLKMVVTYTLAASLTDPTKKIPFVITKTAKDGTKTVSVPVNLAVSAPVASITALTTTDNGSSAWTAASHKGTLTGSNLTQCAPGVSGGASLGVASIALDPSATANSTSLPILYTLSKGIATGTTIPIFCTMPALSPNDAPVNTLPYPFLVP